MRHINLTPELKEKILSDFTQYLDTIRTTDSALTWRFPIENTIKGKVIIPTILWAPEAWLKLQTLVTNSKEEVAWHGLMRKLEDEDEYLVYDIIVYPQQVNGSSAYTDQEEYAKWMQSLPDEVFNNLRMQGHSHVNMSTSPSGTDTGLYNTMLNALNRIPFYMFMITNKRGEMFILFYDFEKNLIFETKEVLQEVLLEDNDTLDLWYKSSMAHVKEIKYTAPVSPVSKAGVAHTTYADKTAPLGSKFTPAEKSWADNDTYDTGYYRDRWAR
jgi:hypothetical protein